MLMIVILLIEIDRFGGFFFVNIEIMIVIIFYLGNI